MAANRGTRADLFARDRLFACFNALQEIREVIVSDIEPYLGVFEIRFLRFSHFRGARGICILLAAVGCNSFLANLNYELATVDQDLTLRTKKLHAEPVYMIDRDAVRIK